MERNGGEGVLRGAEKKLQKRRMEQGEKSSRAKKLTSERDR